MLSHPLQKHPKFAQNHDGKKLKFQTEGVCCCCPEDQVMKIRRKPKEEGEANAQGQEGTSQSTRRPGYRTSQYCITCTGFEIGENATAKDEHKPVCWICLPFGPGPFRCLNHHNAMKKGEDWSVKRELQPDEDARSAEVGPKP